MTDLSSRFRATVNLEQSEPSTVFFYARLIEDQLAELQSDRWATSERLLNSLGTPLFRSASPQQESVVVQDGAALLHVMLYSGYVHAQAAAAEDRKSVV